METSKTTQLELAKPFAKVEKEIPKLIQRNIISDIIIQNILKVSKIDNNT